MTCDLICDPQGRSRSVVRFGQFGGAPCSDSIGDRQYCVAESACNKPPPPVCSDSEFQCESGIVKSHTHYIFLKYSKPWKEKKTVKSI